MAGSVHPGPEDVFAAVEELHKRVKGGYAAVALINNGGIIAFRDPNVRRAWAGLPDSARPRRTPDRPASGAGAWLARAAAYSLHAARAEVLGGGEGGVHVAAR